MPHRKFSNIPCWWVLIFRKYIGVTRKNKKTNERYFMFFCQRSHFCLKKLQCLIRIKATWCHYIKKTKKSHLVWIFGLMVFIYSAVRFRPKGSASNILVKSCKTFWINMTKTVEKNCSFHHYRFIYPITFRLKPRHRGLGEERTTSVTFFRKDARSHPVVNSTWPSH